LFEIAERDCDRELIVDPVSGRFTYGDIAQQVERLAYGLLHYGIGPSDLVVLQLPNWTPFLTFHLALTAIGAVTVNIPIVYREHELNQVIELTEAKALVLPVGFRGHDFKAMGAALQRANTSLEQVFLIGDDAAAEGPGLVGYESLMRHSWESRAGDEPLATLMPSLNDMTALGFTSGTTGDLKGAIFDTEVLTATNRGLLERYGLNEGDRVFSCAPLGHAIGFTHALRMTFAIGGSITLLEYWDPGRAIELLHRERCTYVAGVTPFLIDMIKHPSLQACGGLPAMRVFLCGGTSVPEQLVRDARVALPETFTSPLWGMTECGGVTTCPFDAPEEKLYTTDGSPCGGMELKVVDPEGGTLPPGADGELMVRGPMVTRGYYRQPELTAESYLPDGYFRTGDQARMDEDGYVKITGRIKDLIIRGGVNISPVEIENVIFSHPKVVNVAVVGMPDPRLGERSCAFVILKDGQSLDLAEMRVWMAHAGVSKPKWPERVELVDTLPTTPSGKVQKFRLREIIAARAAAEETGSRGGGTGG
jgi:acyl-CoA synthetase (AMP-forming)/AMP-acid ligase II